MFKKEKAIDNDGYQRDKGISLDEGGWIHRFNLWAWRVDIMNMNGWCPIFWMTVLALALSPVLITINTVFALLKLAANMAASTKSEKPEVEAPDPYKLRSHDLTVARCLDYKSLYGENISAWKKDIGEKVANNLIDKWKLARMEAYEKLKAEEAKKAKEREIYLKKKAEREKVYAKFSQKVPYILGIIVIAVLALVTKHLINASVWCVEFLWNNKIDIGIALGVVLGIIVLGIIFINVCDAIAKNRAARSRKKAEERALNQTLEVEPEPVAPKDPNVIMEFLDTTVQKISDFLEAGLQFIIVTKKTLYAVYKRKCPMVTWEKKDK